MSGAAKERAADSERPTVLIAGGGTGGHVFPALAVADALTRIADVRVVFVGTERGLEARVIPERGYALETLHVEPMKGGGAFRFLRGGAVAGAAAVRAAGLLRRVRPRVVLSVGGYAAGPVSLAAAAMRIPVTLLEPNAVMGFANRVLAPACRRAYVAWLSAAGASTPRGAVRAFGVPLREGFEASPYEVRGQAGASVRVLVLGGSQGAQAINERLPDAIARAQRVHPALSVVHQTGREREADVRAAYEREGAKNVTVAAFLDDVAGAMRDADVVVGRAGASTVAEISAVGRASILIPFPFAADDHQAKNAAALVSAGGALAIRQEAADGVRLARELVLLFQEPERRAAMAEAARSVGRPQAAAQVAADLLGLAGIVPRPLGPGLGKAGVGSRTVAEEAEDLPDGRVVSYGRIEGRGQECFEVG